MESQKTPDSQSNPDIWEFQQRITIPNLKICYRVIVIKPCHIGTETDLYTNKLKQNTQT